MPPMDMPPTRAAAAALLLVCTVSTLGCTRRDAPPRDPVRHPNRRGTVAFASAGPNTRTTQLFVNLADNLRLDALGFAPIGQVVEGLEVADGLYGQYGERPSQDSIRLQGDAYLKRAYPNLDQIRTARIVGACPCLPTLWSWIRSSAGSLRWRRSSPRARATSGTTCGSPDACGR